MDRINKALLERICKVKGIKQRQAYQLIENKVNETKLNRKLAAICLAADLNVNISKYATEEELEKLYEVINVYKK